MCVFCVGVGVGVGGCGCVCGCVCVSVCVSVCVCVCVTHFSLESLCCNFFPFLGVSLYVMIILIKLRF